MSVCEKKSTIWCNEKGRELLALKAGDKLVRVALYEGSAEQLRDLSEACLAAANALELIHETQPVVG